jgi:ubiquinone/menaquinone biosynthesis C-methylase UbiE
MCPQAVAADWFYGERIRLGASPHVSRFFARVEVCISQRFHPVGYLLQNPLIQPVQADGFLVQEAPAMLPRVLEAEVMDTPEEARDYDAMDHSVVNTLFVDDFLRHWDGRSPVLDVGTGTAQIPIELARRCPSVRIVAVDLAGQMLLLARHNVSRLQLEGCIRLEQVDAKKMPYADDTFAAVMSNSIIHHLPEPERGFSEMHRVCQKGGLLFVRDLLRPSSQAALRELVHLYAAEANEHQRAMFAASLHAALTIEEVRAYVAELGYPPDTVQQTSDRHWTWVARKLDSPRSRS